MKTHRQECEDMVSFVYLTLQQVHWCIEYAIYNNINTIPFTSVTFSLSFYCLLDYCPAWILF